MSIICSQLAFDHIHELISQEVEEIWVMALSSTKKPIKTEMIFRGTADKCLVHPRDIFRFAIQSNACSLIIAHNHPSGDVIPSAADIRFTHKLRQVGMLLEIPVVDHIVIAGDKFLSFCDEGWFTSQNAVHSREADQLVLF